MATVTKLEPQEIAKLSETFDRYLASKTSTALSTMFSETINHSITMLDDGMSNINDIKIADDEITLCGVRLNGKGDTHIEICYTTKLKHAKTIASKLLGQDVSEIDEMGISAIQEVANIMTGSFFNAMASGTGFRVDLSTPDFAKGELAPLLSVCARDVMNPTEHAIIADAKFEGQESGFKLHMMIMQDPDNARKLLSNDSASPTENDNSPSYGGENSELDALLDESVSDEYFIGAENSELDAIVDSALSGDAQN